MEIRHLKGVWAGPAGLEEPLLFGDRMKNRIMVRMNHPNAAPPRLLRQ